MLPPSLQCRAYMQKLYAIDSEASFFHYASISP
jgi:hypothetical protein